MRHLIFLLAISIAALAVDAGAQTASTPAPTTLDEYLVLARANNPFVASAVARARAARERVGVAKGFPDPFLTYGYYVSPDIIQGRQELIFSQPIPFPGKRGLRGDVSARQADMQSRDADAMALDVEFEVKTAFYEYVGLTEKARVLESESELLRRMRDVAQVRYSSGTSEQQEILKIELALSRVADETTVNERDLATSRARLNELIARDASLPLPAPVWSMPDVSVIDRVALVDSAHARRPEVASARDEIAMAEASRRLAKREYIPDFMIGFDYEYGLSQDGMWELMAGINLPIWIGKRRAMVREAEAMRESAEQRLRAETLRTTREVEETVARARAGRDRENRFRTALLPQAEATFASSEAGYRTGRVDFLDYLDSERMLLETRKEYAMVIAELGTQLAALERAIGVAAGEK